MEGIEKKLDTHTRQRDCQQQGTCRKKVRTFPFLQKKTKNSSSWNEGKRTTTTKETEETPCLERDKKEGRIYTQCVCGATLGPKNPEG